MTPLTVETFPLFQIAGNERIGARERAELVRQRVRLVLDRYEDELPPVVVDRVLGATVVRAGDQILITVMDEDVPEFELSALSAEERHQLEVEVAQVWRVALMAELARGSTMRTPGYRRMAWALVGLLLVAAYLLQRLVHWAGRRYFHSPAWSARFLVWAMVIFTALRFPRLLNEFHRVARERVPELVDRLER